MYMASAGPVRRRCPPGYLHAHPLSLGSPGAYHACTRLSNDARLAREQPLGDLHAAQITPSPPPTPSLLAMLSMSRGCHEQKGVNSLMGSGVPWTKG